MSRFQVRTLKENMKILVAYDGSSYAKRALDDAVKIESRERFWSATVAANLTGALIANRQLGLHNINVRRVFDWMVEEVKTMQDNTRLNYNDFAAIVGEFLLMYNANILVCNRKSTSRNNIAAAPLVTPRGALKVRYEPDTKCLYIIKHELRQYCVEKQVSFGDLTTELSKTGAYIGELRTKLDLGTEINAPPVIAIEFDADLPEICFHICLGAFHFLRAVAHLVMDADSELW